MLMKMAAVLPVALILLGCSCVSCADPSGTCESVKAGGTVVVPMTIAVDESYKLTWKHKDIPILRRSKGLFSLGSKDLVTANGSLQLTNVAQSNAGVYTAEVHDADGKIKGEFKPWSLCVLDPVSKPTVDPPECLPKDKPTKVKFTCKVPSQANVTWLQKDEGLDEKGPTLTREINQVNSDPIVCRVSNGISTEESEAVHHSCVDYASFWLKDTFGISNWILVASGGGVVVLLIIVVIVCCVCTKRRKRLQLEEEGELRLAWTNEKQQHQHLNCPDQHQHRQNQHAAGHTGPRQHRSRQQRPGAPDQPRPSPRRPAQAPRPPGECDEEQPPPLPQPRKIGPGARRV